MAKKTIYLIRHGETEFNKKGAVQGRGINAELNNTGQKQAAAFFEMYKEIPFQKIYVSSLIRTLQSVQGFVDSGIEFEALEGLDEISWGVVEGKTSTEVGHKLFSDLIENWKNGNTNIALEGGESPEEVVVRQKEAFEIILDEKQHESLILIAMHGRAIRILLSHLLDLPLESMDQFEHSNTCLYILEYDYETKKFELKLENDTKHLLN